MKVVLGSTSGHKLEAVKKACQLVGLQAEVVGVKTTSGVNEQPVGFEETFTGAHNRATEARLTDSSAIAVGVESGIFWLTQGIVLDLAVVVVLIPHEEGTIVTSSSGIGFPEKYVRIAQERGFDSTTVGSVITEYLGGDSTDPHSTLTDGKVKRQATLVEAIGNALRQLSNF